MSSAVHRVSPKTSALEAFRQLTRGRDSVRLIVEDHLGEPVGILSKSDRMKAIQLRSFQADKLQESES